MDAKTTTTPTLTPGPRELSVRLERLRGSAKRCGIYMLPVFFVGLTILLLIVNWRPEYSVIAHTVESLFRGAVGAVCCSAVAYGGMLMMTTLVERSTTRLTRRGKLVKVERVAKPTIVGGQFMTYVVGGALGRLWEPIAPALSTKLPVLSVGYSFDIDGKRVYASEVFYGDERVTRDENGDAWALVDPASPHTSRWLIKERGQLEDCPFALAILKPADQANEIGSKKTGKVDKPSR